MGEVCHPIARKMFKPMGFACHLLESCARLAPNHEENQQEWGIATRSNELHQCNADFSHKLYKNGDLGPLSTLHQAQPGAGSAFSARDTKIRLFLRATKGWSSGHLSRNLIIGFPQIGSGGKKTQGFCDHLHSTVSVRVSVMFSLGPNPCPQWT